MPPVLENDSFFLLVRGGHGHFIINGVSFTVSPGSVGWINCTQVLTIEPEPGETLEIWSLMADYSTLNYLMFQESTINSRYTVISGAPVIAPGSKNAGRIRRIFEDFDNINARRNNGSALVKVSLLGQLSLTYIMESMELEEDYSSEKWPLGWRACIYIATNSLTALKATDAARALDTDLATLNRHLRISIGLSFNQLVNRNRCLLAASFFLCDGMPFEYIARIVGYNSEITFYRNFKKVTGMTPSEYRDTLLSSGGGAHCYRGMIIDDRIITMISYLYNNFTESVSLESIAKNTFTSESLVNTLFTKTFGVSYKYVLSLFRVKYAESLLSSSNFPLVDISALAGFNSINTFNRLFTKINGQSPGEYRLMNVKRSKANDK